MSGPADSPQRDSLPTVSTDRSQAAAQLFMDLTHHVANGQRAEAMKAVQAYSGEDPRTALLDVIAVTALAPFVIAIGLRRLGYPSRPGGIHIFGPAAHRGSVEQALMYLMITEHLNRTDEAETAAYTADVVQAHFRQRGGQGLALLLFALVDYSAHIMRLGAYDTGAGHLSGSGYPSAGTPGDDHGGTSAPLN